MQSAACAVFNISRARMMEHLPGLNQCNFENLMARSIIRVRSGAPRRHRVSLLWMTDRTNWQEVVPQTPPAPPKDATTRPHSTQVTQNASPHCLDDALILSSWQNALVSAPKATFLHIWKANLCKFIGWHTVLRVFSGYNKTITSNLDLAEVPHDLFSYLKKK